MEFMTAKEAAARWGISDRRVRILCAEGKIDGVTQKGRAYLIPADSLKPVDGRAYRGVELSEQYAPLFAAVDAQKSELDRRRPLTQGELQRLRDEFLVDFTYNSNAIEGNTLTLKETALALEGVTIDKKPLKDL
jgi:excisionase family DNA binding protein